MYKYLLFDLDGTIIDSIIGVCNCAKYTLDKLNYKLENEDDYRKFMGPPLVESFKNVCGFNESKTKEAISIYRDYYQKYSIYECILYPNVKKNLAKLKEMGYKIVLTTNKNEKFALKILEHFKIDKYFDFVSGEKENYQNKTKIIEFAISSLNINKDEAVLIGDTYNDYLGASNNGIDFIFANYGYGNKRDFDSLDLIANSTDDIVKILKEKRV